ncbi:MULTISPECIES: hypothetical protein [Xenorhabdus]|uniref:hypothetical protein n=1 Tax=Xenorhabdus TaxID=626 RepID=UPI0012E0B96D|nr:MULTISPECIES: hypothetical protein [Xenorhabdus]
MESALVETETGYEDWLYEGDKVICNGCWRMGHIVILPCEPVPMLNGTHDWRKNDRQNRYSQI